MSDSTVVAVESGGAYVSKSKSAVRSVAADRRGVSTLADLDLLLTTTFGADVATRSGLDLKRGTQP